MDDGGEPAAIYLITGPMAAGKSTVSRLLAARFERGVYLEGDTFRRSILTGREEMTPDASPEAVRQLRLRYRLAASAADTYAQAGFTVAYEDVIAGPDLGQVRTMIRHRPCHVVVLLPSREAVAQREAGRRNKGYTDWTVDELYVGFEHDTPRVGVWLDTTRMTPDETVDAVLEATTAVRHPVVVTDYDPTWPVTFERLAEPVREAVADLDATVEHVGSTSVPGLAAKSVIDMDVVIRSVDDVAPVIERLRGLGYVYQGDKGIPGREAFAWPPGSPPHHLYVVVAGTRPHADHVRFRDALRRDAEVARRYAELKRRLAERHADDGVAYTEAKAGFISEVLAGAPPMRSELPTPADRRSEE